MPRMLALPKAAIRARVERAARSTVCRGRRGHDIRDVDLRSEGPRPTSSRPALAVTPSARIGGAAGARLREAFAPDHHQQQ